MSSTVPPITPRSANTSRAASSTRWRVASRRADRACGRARTPPAAGPGIHDRSIPFGHAVLLYASTRLRGYIRIDTILYRIRSVPTRGALRRDPADDRGRSRADLRPGRWTMFERLGSLTYRFRFLIVLAWVARRALGRLLRALAGRRGADRPDRVPPVVCHLGAGRRGARAHVPRLDVGQLDDARLLAGRRPDRGRPRLRRRHRGLDDRRRRARGAARRHRERRHGDVAPRAGVAPPERGRRARDGERQPRRRHGRERRRRGRRRASGRTSRRCPQTSPAWWRT